MPRLTSTFMVQMVVCALAVVSLLYIPVPIAFELARDYAMALDSTGHALTAFGLAYASGFLIFGPLSDRFGRRAVMVGGLLALAAISIGFSLISTPLAFLVCRALQGLAASSFPPVALAFLAETGSPRQRTWGLAWMSTAFLSAGLLGQMYGATLAARWGFGVALWPLVAVYLTTALRIALLPERPRLARGSLRNVYQPLPSLIRDRSLRRVYVPAFVLLMAFVAFYVGLDRHLQTSTEYGMSRLQSRAVALPSFLAPLLAATLIQRWKAIRVATLGLVLASLGLCLAAFADETAVNLMLSASVIFVAGIGFAVPALIARTAAVAQPSSRGMAVALYMFILFIGASLGPSLAAYCAEWSGPALFMTLAVGMSAIALYSGTGGESRSLRHANQQRI